MPSLDTETRIARLERLVEVLARGILAHEYSKDLEQHKTKAICIALANEGDLEKAMTLAQSIYED